MKFITFYIQKIKGLLYCDIIIYCKITFLAIMQHHNLDTEREIRIL